MQTIRLFNSDHYLAEFNAEVVAIEGFNVILDQTAFYALSGGQAGDTGMINDTRVSDTQIQDGKHVHILDEAPSFGVGDTVHGVIDWNRRYRIMKIHSASHIMEHIFYMNFGVLERIGSNVDDKKDRSDYKTEDRLDPELLKKTEVEINAFLSESHEIKIEVDNEGLRSWISGPYLDHCGGTHVRNTSEIGLIKLKRKNPGRGKERVETSLKE
jgi:Ser-tRNA(Ala) deacylase AlaX